MKRLVRHPDKNNKPVLANAEQQKWFNLAASGYNKYKKAMKVLG